MFENVLGQEEIKKQLTDDLRKNKLPPSILYYGPNSAGKFTAALELARCVSCSQGGSWGCTCPSCLKHKEMTSPDLLILGARDHIPEIKAASQTLLKNRQISSRYLFLRTVRKLTLRFDARLWDADEQKFLKAAPIISEIEELSSLLSVDAIENIDDTKLKKTVEAIVLQCTKLQDDCAYDSIPINQVRKASAWIRLMPSGSKKILIVENADKMQEGARNAFLKILEEPPSYGVFILTTERRGAIMPTILSRVRSYKFGERSDASFEEVITRVFKGELTEENRFGSFNLLRNFLYSFLPVSFKTIQITAAYFYDFIFDLILREQKKIPPALYDSVNKFKTENNIANEKTSVSAIVNSLNKFKPHTIFVLFLNSLLYFLQRALKEADTNNLSAKETEAYFKISNLIKTAETANDVYNISPQAVLENLSEKIKEAGGF